MKICCWIGSRINETNVSWNERGIEEKNIAEMEAGNSMKLIFYFATSFPRRIVRDELSCDELSGNPIYYDRWLNDSNDYV